MGNVERAPLLLQALHPPCDSSIQGQSPGGEPSPRFDALGRRAWPGLQAHQSLLGAPLVSRPRTVGAGRRRIAGVGEGKVPLCPAP